MAGTPLPFERTDGLVKLQQHVAAKHFVRFVVGAGPSIASGLPNWNVLNQRLLQEYLAARNEGLELEREDLRKMAAPFVDRFGRDAVVDLVREELSRTKTGAEAFQRALCRALYSRRSHYLPSSGHKELAAFQGRHTSFFTFNYDDLLETACGEEFRPYTSADLDAPSQSCVTHLHGLMNRDGTVHGELVLSERDYHRTGKKSFAQRELERLLDGDERVAVVLVGLSLADPRLRGALLDRLGREKRGDGRPRGADVYVIMKESDCASSSDLALRLAHGLIRASEPGYWKDGWEVNPIMIPEHDLVPFALRKARLGLDGSTWVVDAANSLGIEDRFLLPEAQRRGQEALMETLELIRKRFTVPDGEHLQLGAFIPRRNGRLGLGFACHQTEGFVVDAALAEERQLAVTSLGEAQGAAGYAFLTGMAVDAEPGSAYLDRNFDEATVEAWRSGAAWQLDPKSLLCEPVYDQATAKPQGVAYLASTRDEAFWRGLDNRRRLALHDLLRKTWVTLVHKVGTLEKS